MYRISVAVEQCSGSISEPEVNDYKYPTILIPYFRFCFNKKQQNQSQA